jgi:cytochrome c1
MSGQPRSLIALKTNPFLRMGGSGNGAGYAAAAAAAQGFFSSVAASAADSSVDGDGDGDGDYSFQDEARPGLRDKINALTTAPPGANNHLVTLSGNPFLAVPQGGLDRQTHFSTSTAFPRRRPSI